MNLAVDMRTIDAALDLRSRLDSVPESAAVRGVFFNQLRDSLGRKLSADAATLDRFVGSARSSHKWYPAREIVRAQAVAGALVHADPREGMRYLSRGMASFFSTTWYGRVFQRFLRPQPYEALQWVAFSRDYIANFGSLRLERRGPTRALIHFYDEYCWLDSCQRGGCEGLLEACGVVGTVVAELDTPFRGRLDISWAAPD
jgi:uncharacterized protein (TIGR02265 family)